MTSKGLKVTLLILEFKKLTNLKKDGMFQTFRLLVSSGPCQVGLFPSCFKKFEISFSQKLISFFDRIAFYPDFTRGMEIDQASIYKAFSLDHDILYTGCTTNTLKTRWGQHLMNFYRTNMNKILWYSAIDDRTCPSSYVWIEIASKPKNTLLRRTNFN